MTSGQKFREKLNSVGEAVVGVFGLLIVIGLIGELARRYPAYAFPVAASVGLLIAGLIVLYLAVRVVRAAWSWQSDAALIAQIDEVKAETAMMQEQRRQSELIRAMDTSLSLLTELNIKLTERVTSLEKKSKSEDA